MINSTTDKTTASSSMSEHKEIPSLLVPIGDGHKLLLPTVSVAEMVPYQEPQMHPEVSVDKSPAWFLGEIDWRGCSVPMVSYERLNGRKEPAILPTSQLLVMNSTGVHPQLPFFCLPTQGIPRLSRVAENEISINQRDILGKYEEMHVFLAGEEATIPDVSKIERACVELLL